MTWDWCPNLEDSSSTPYAKLYPGDKYVDWTCLDGYNQGSSSPSFSNLYGKSYADLTQVAPTKPMMVGEVGSYEYGSGDKGSWISDMLSALPTRFPQIKALVWFNWRIFEGGTWKNWDIESSASSQSVLRDGHRRAVLRRSVELRNAGVVPADSAAAVGRMEPSRR